MVLTHFTIVKFVRNIFYHFLRVLKVLKNFKSLIFMGFLSPFPLSIYIGVSVKTSRLNSVYKSIAAYELELRNPEFISFIKIMENN